MGKVKLSRVCVLCKKDVKDELKFGVLRKTKLMRVHYYCLLLSETICQSGEDDEGILGFMASDIAKELNRTKTQKCCYCHETPATIGCENMYCNRKFHVYCGYENNAIFNFDKFNARCNLHIKPSNVPAHIKKSLTDYHCLICLEMFDSNTKQSDVIWASCCKSNVLLHGDCIRQMALNAGYFTKCPGCNNKAEFIKTIKAWGVFVPERDASWELDGNAFSELLYVHSKCDQENCSCPDGREYSEENGKWKVMLCKMCGSVGAHVACSELKRKFICEVCSMDVPTSTPIEGTSNSTFIDLTTSEEGYDELIKIEVLDEPDEEDNVGQQDHDVEVIEDFNIEMQHTDIEPHDHNRNTPQKKNDIELSFSTPDKLVKKRPFDVIDNIDTSEDYSMSPKKQRISLDVPDINNSKTYKRISETLMLEDASSSFTVMLDDNNEVEFISSPNSKESNDVFLDQTLSKSDESEKHYNKENEINCNILQSYDIQKNFLPDCGSKGGKKIVELNFRNYTSCAKVSF